MNRSMAELAARWSELLIADVPRSQRLTAAAQTGSILRQPANEEQIQRAERRLGRVLPASYREFLLLSNGAYGDDYGPTLAPPDGGPEDPRSESAVVGVGFLPVEDLRWLRDATPWLAEMMAEMTEIVEHRHAVAAGQQAPAWSALADGLVIATGKHPGTTVLIPLDGLDEWQLWNVHKESTVAYRSFRSFLEYQVTQREPVTAFEEVETLVARATAGDHEATMKLSRVVAPEAVPLLVSATDNPGLCDQAVLGLGRIGTPEAVDALIELGVRGTRGLVVAGTERARDELVAWGRFEELSELGDPRAIDLAAQLIAETHPDVRSPWRLNAAVSVIEQSGDRRFAPLLLPLLHADEEVQFHAAIALAHLGAPDGERQLVVLAERREFPHRAAARAHLTRLRRIREAG